MKRVFIANRGEIAVRIIRACRELGLVSIVGYSDADRASLAVRYADEAYRIGEAPAPDSYLNIPRLISIMEKTNCDAVHPGYGFLAERAAFAAACEKSGIVFIGPRSEIIDLMGDKTRARQAVAKAGTPVVPGTMEPLKDFAEAQAFAREFGYPVMIKASAGGGGKGLRLANIPSELEDGFRLAQSEAQSAFGDSSVYLEKKIDAPHHVEVQILADHHGHTIHLGERECSIQRRHQKVIEETPSPFISANTRKKMTDLAAAAAASIGYTSAGTMEFLVDSQQNFYFLEMNTRLQVEHPITEMVTGVDIVKEQIRIASGLPLSYRQQEIRFYGAAIQCRIYAEDPNKRFMPAPGKITGLRVPGGPGIRDDSGIYEGFEVSIHYDPLLSKLICWGRDREEAIGRMKRALEEYQVLGIKTTIPFFQRIMDDPVFLSGDVNTSFIDEVFFKNHAKPEEPKEDIALIAAAIAQESSIRAQPSSGPFKKAAWRLLARKEGLR